MAAYWLLYLSLLHSLSFALLSFFYEIHFFTHTASQGIEEFISVFDNATLGDKGNPQVTKELDQLGKVTFNAAAIDIH